MAKDLRDDVLDVCRAMPGATEQVQWGADLVFKVGGKMFACFGLEPDEKHPYVGSFKCSEQSFYELVDQPGCVPAPYLARAKWVAIESYRTLPFPKLKSLLEDAYAIIRSGLPKSTRAALANGAPTKAKAKAKKKSPKKAAKKAAPKRKAARRRA